MAGIQTLELDIEIKTTADKFYEIFKKKEEVSTGKTGIVAVHDRDSESKSSVQTWSFIVDGKVEHIKEKIRVDEENRSLSFVALEGDVLNKYKSYKIILHAVPKGEGCVAKWTWEYEKLHEDIPPPTKYADFVADFTRDLETRLSKS